jgi:hypothetical protein
MHFDDLTLCHYQDGPFDPANWRAPLLAIGWLERPYPFPSGEVPHGLADTLHAMAEKARELYALYCFWGLEHCSFCVAENRTPPGPVWSQENLFVPGQGVIYLSPGGIGHYVEVHSYCPPQEYVDAVLSCPPYGSSRYCEALRTANRGESVPLLPDEEFLRLNTLPRRPQP